MSYKLTPQGEDYFYLKYNINKNLLIKIQYKVNCLGIIKNNDDYFRLLESIFSNIFKQTEESIFNKNKSKIKTDEIIAFEVYRVFGINKLENSLIKPKIKKYYRKNI